MTRINSSISARLLTDEHLLAEHREIKRLPTLHLARVKTNKKLSNIPEAFCLGEGHVNFFLDKFGFTLQRYISIRTECLIRGFNVENYSSKWTDVVGHEYWKTYSPTVEENRLLILRISQRLLNSPKPYWHYYGKQITKQEAVKLLIRK